MTRPNVLFVLVDQMAAKWMSVYGFEAAKTPAIRRLADSGVVFENCYCNGPMCVPSRASMFSGRLVSNVDAFDNGCEFPAQIPTFVHHLRAAGYETSLAGKAHFIGPDQLHGFARRLNAEIYPSSFRWSPSWDQPVSLNAGSNVEQVQQSGTCLWSLQLQYDEETCFKAMERLRVEARRLEDAPEVPFFLNVSFMHPHDPFYTTEEWWNLYEDEEVPMPWVRRDDDALHQYDRWLQTHHGVDLFPLSDQNIQDARRAYLGMCSYVDSLVGKLLDELERLGLRDTTAVVFASDHGEMLGDLYPTLCALGNATQRLEYDTIDGNSLIRLLESDQPDWKDEALIEYCGEGVLAPMRAVRHGSLKLVDVPGTPTQLFDLESDPHETANMISESGYEAAAERLEERLNRLWNPGELRARIVASQRQRATINAAHSIGTPPSWDHDPSVDPGTQYVRTDAQEASRMARCPRHPDSQTDRKVLRYSADDGSSGGVQLPQTRSYTHRRRYRRRRT